MIHSDRDKSDAGGTFKTIERAKQQWESTVDALPELICMVDGERKIIRANRTLERWQLGDVRQVAGHDFHSVVHPACQDSDCYLYDLISGDGLGTPPGTVRQVEAYDPIIGRHLLIEVCPIPGNGGPEETAVSIRELEETSPFLLDRAIILHDITEHKRLVRSLKRHAHRLRTTNGISRAVLAAESPQEIVVATSTHLQSFLPVHQAIVFLLDPQRSYLSLLAAEAPLAKLQPGDRLPLADLHTISHRSLSRPYYVRNLARMELRSEMEEDWHRQGVVAYTNLPLLIDGRWLGSLFVSTRHALGFSTDDLDVLEEVAELLTVALNQSQLNLQLQKTNAELQQMLRTKQEKMQDLSHELRSPLALIQGFVDLLQDEALGPLTPKQQQALSVVGDKGEHLLRLIERLLMLQTIGDRQPDFELTDMAMFLKEIVAPWELPASNRGIKLVLKLEAPLPCIPLDNALFPQVITNLLDNALKFTPAGGTITVNAWSTPDEVVIQVVDQGEGIPPDRLEAIFERYSQGNGMARARGAGIGLALCREVLRAHGGTINAASPTEKQGSTFTVRLPRSEPTAASAKEQEGGVYGR